MNNINRRMRSFSAPAAASCAAAGLLVLVGAAPSAHAQTLVASYNFNDTGTKADNGTGNAAYDLSLYDHSGTAADMHGAAGSGVSGSATDLALDLNPVANGVQFDGGIAAGGTAATNLTLTGTNFITSGFTVTGWFNPDSLAAFASGGASRIIDGNSIHLLAVGNGNSSQSGLQLQVGSNSVNPLGGSNARVYNPQAGVWEFFAITYTPGASNGASSVAGGTVTFYKGTQTAATTQLSSTNFTTSVSYSATSSIVIGDNTSLARAFDGLLDNFNFYTGALTQSQIEAIRLADITPAQTGAEAPEPGALALALTGAMSVALPLLRRRRRLG